MSNPYQGLDGREITDQVLLKLAAEELPQLPIACKTCPAALWELVSSKKTGNTAVKCYCRLKHLYTWAPDVDSEVLDCSALYMEEEEEDQPTSRPASQTSSATSQPSQEPQNILPAYTIDEEEDDDIPN